MNNIVSLFQMVFSKGKSPESNMEQARSRPSMSTTLPIQEAQLPHIDYTGRPNISPDDQLNLFRHLTGITSHASMTHSRFGSEPGGRPATNLGIYARVVHNEQVSKIGHKYFSWLINGCLGLQIIVAASLTAMGAAGASHTAVTAFGAINTVIAGVLTFLKGSGLPNRLKYYNSEWKRVREFIEQRERDFSRPGCDLDLYAVVAMVESMYEEVKQDLEASTPDRFAGFNTSRKTFPQQIDAPVNRAISFSLPRATPEPLSEKYLESGFGSRVKDIASEIGHRASQARDAVKEFQDTKEHVSENASSGVKDFASRVEQLESNFGEKVKDLVSDISHRAHQAHEAVHDMESHRRSEVEDLGKEAKEFTGRFERTASGKFKPVTINLSGTTSATISGDKSHEEARDGEH